MKRKLRSIFEELVRLTLDGETFTHEAPKEFSRTYDCIRNPDIDWEEVYKYERKIRKKLDETDFFEVHKYSINDHGDVVLDVMPVPMPNVLIDRGKDLLRYRATLFVHKEGVLVSLRRVQHTVESKGFAGIDLSKKEGKLVEKIKSVCGKKVLEKPIQIDAMVVYEQNIARHTSYIGKPSEEILARAVTALPRPVIWAAVHAIMATLFPWLNEEARPFYYPAIRVSSNKEVAEMQVDILRDVLAGLAFGRAPGQNMLRLPELDLQDGDSIQTLHRIDGLPVLARVDRDAVQKDLTEEMQRAHGVLIATGLAKHPLKTVPLLVGKALPAENVIFAMDWQESEGVNPKIVEVLQQGIGYLLRDMDSLVDALNEAFDGLSISGRKYSEAFFEEFVRVLDGFFFSANAYRGTLLAIAAETIEDIHEQQKEQQARFERAMNILDDVNVYASGIADSAKEMQPHHFGFVYKTQKNETGLAIELQRDFPRFITEKLGLFESDSLDFRYLLRNRHWIEEMQRNIRGRTGASCGHVFIQRPCGE